MTEQQVLLRRIVVDGLDAHVRRPDGGDTGLAGRGGRAGAAAAGAARGVGDGAAATGIAVLELHVRVDVLQSEVDRLKTN